MKPVNNLSVLKRMQKAGIITFHKDTGKKLKGFFGGSHTCYYIETAPALHFSFEGKMYMSKYVDGCFFPFIFEL